MTVSIDNSGKRHSMQMLLQRAKLATTSPHARKITIMPGSNEVVHIPVHLDPEFATLLLDNNDNNRSIDWRAVDTYAADISEGRWRQNGSTMSVASTGRLLDGQQRCWAVIQSQKSIPVTLAFNLEDSFDVFSSIDIGKGRTMTNIMQILGHPTNVSVQATSNMLATLSGVQLRTKQRQAEYLIEHIDEIEPWVSWAAQLSSQSPFIEVARRRMRALGTVTLAALAIHMTRKGADPDTVQEFFAGTIMELSPATLRELSDTRIGILKLLNRRLKNGTPLNRGTGSANNIRSLVEFALYIKCYNKYVNDERMLKAQISETEYSCLDELPLPEKGAKR